MEALLSAFDPIIQFPGHASPSSKTSPSQKPDPVVCFQRPELNLILSRYGVMVSQGLWRDYAIDVGRDFAIFSIFRHTSDCPLYRIEKHPKLAKKQGAYLIRNDKGTILKRGTDLKQLLRIFEKKITLIQN